MTGEPSAQLPAGSRLRSLAVTLFDRATATRVLLPAIADLQHEMAEAQTSSRAARIATGLAAYAAIWQTFLVCLVVRRTEGEGREWLRTMLAGLATLVAITAGLIYMPARHLLEVMDEVFVLLLVPQALAVSLPCSVLGAGLFRAARRTGDGDEGQGIASVRGVLAYSLVAALLSLVVMVWVVPSANDAYRQRAYSMLSARGVHTMMNPRSVPKGYAEMTISELIRARRVAVWRRIESNTLNLEPERASYYLHVKGSVPAAALAFGLMAIALSPLRRRWRGPAFGLALAVAMLLLYYTLQAGLRQMTWAATVPAWLAAWAPPMMFALLAVMLMWRRVARHVTQ